LWLARSEARRKGVRMVMLREEGAVEVRRARADAMAEQRREERAGRVLRALGLIRGDSRKSLWGKEVQGYTRAY